MSTSSPSCPIGHFTVFQGYWLIRYNPSGSWTATHQMTVNGKRDGFRKADLRAAARSAGLKQGREDTLLEEVTAAVARWPEFAARAQLSDDSTEKIRSVHP